MAQQKGRLFLLKLGSDGLGGTLAGLRENSFTINNEPVDVTNKDSGGWRTLLEGAGTQSVSISANGVASDSATYETLKGYAQANSINGYQLIGPDNDALSGSFQITSLQESGAHNDAITFSITLESSGTISFTQA